MELQNKSIDWGDYLYKYSIPTVLKESLLKPYFESLSFIEPIIDLGCGTGYFSEIILKGGKKVVGIDKNGSIESHGNFTYIKEDIFDFKSNMNFNTVLLINVLSVEPAPNRDRILKKVFSLLTSDGMAYILTTSSKIFLSPTNSDLISFERTSDDTVHIKVKLINGEYINFDDYIVSEDEITKMLHANGFDIQFVKEFRHQEMDRPVYILYIVKKSLK